MEPTYLKLIRELLGSKGSRATEIYSRWVPENLVVPKFCPELCLLLENYHKGVARDYLANPCPHNRRMLENVVKELESLLG